jgi:hypothetical protein
VIFPNGKISKAQIAGLSIVFVWFFVGGILHFAATDIEASIVPPYIPCHVPEWALWLVWWSTWRPHRTSGACPMDIRGANQSGS